MSAYNFHDLYEELVYKGKDILVSGSYGTRTEAIDHKAWLSGGTVWEKDIMGEYLHTDDIEIKKIFEYDENDQKVEIQFSEHEVNKIKHKIAYEYNNP